MRAALLRLLQGRSGVRFAGDHANASLRPSPPIRYVVLDDKAGLLQLFDQDLARHAVTAPILGNPVGVPQPKYPKAGRKIDHRQPSAGFQGLE